MLPGIDILQRVYYEPIRTRYNTIVSKPDFGWTPCEHYQQCIGWCPICLSLKHRLEHLNDIYGYPH